MSKNFSISSYEFSDDLESKLYQNHRDFLLWPIVYLLKDESTKDAYVGETTDVITCGLPRGPRPERGLRRRDGQPDLLKLVDPVLDPLTFPWQAINHLTGTSGPTPYRGHSEWEPLTGS